MECLNLMNPLFSLNESVQNEKHTKKTRKKKEDSSNACSNIPLRMNIAGFFEIDAKIKSILFYPHQRTMKIIEGKKNAFPFIITCENKRRRGDWHILLLI